MTVIFEARHPCLLCGYQHHLLQMSSVRTSTSGLASLGHRECPECGTPNLCGTTVRYRMLPADEAGRGSAPRTWT